MKGLRLAVGTLTIIPVGDLDALTARDGRRAMMLAPIAALPLGLAVAALLWCAHAVSAPPLAAGFAAVGVLAYGTRAMHLDGLADTVDGLGAGWTRERAVAVMKSGDVGPMGVAALLVALGMQSACFAALVPTPLLAALAVMLSRGACTVLASTMFRPARPDGLGALMAGTVPSALLVPTAALGMALLAVASPGGVTAASSIGHAVVAVSLAGAAVVGLGRRATRVIGGITGDVFGAGVEIALTCVLFVLAGGGLT